MHINAGKFKKNSGVNNAGHSVKGAGRIVRRRYMKWMGGSIIKRRRGHS